MPPLLTAHFTLTMPLSVMNLIRINTILRA